MRAVAVLCSLLALRAASARVHISAEGENIDFDHQDSEVSSYYGGTVTIFCSGTDATKLTLTSDDSEDVQAIETVNSTTVKLTSNDRAIGEYKYICDDETSRAELLVSVIPDITVKSQNVVIRNVEGKRLFFFVPIGEDYEVFCFASARDSLKILKNDEEIQTYVLNLTSIKTMKQQEMKNTRIVYSCGTDDTRIAVIVYFDEPPAPINFHCVGYKVKTTCNWNVRTLETSFTLIYTDTFRKSTRVCEVSSNLNSITCEINSFHLMKQGISLDNGGFFIMESCNLFVCINETFRANRVSFTKPNAPSNLKLRVTSAFQAVVSWRVEDTFSNILQYKVTYQTPGTAASELDESSLLVTCTTTKSVGTGLIVDDCEAKLKLPCPRTHYEIEVHGKSLKCFGITNLNVQFKLH